MAAAAAGEAATQPLKYKTWVLKVPIHCVGCKREVKKLLQNIEGVYSTSIDAQLQKVIVSGNIEAEVLVKKLSKTGKHAEIWNEKSAEKKSGEKEKKSAEKEKKTEKQNDPKNCQKNEQTTKSSDSESNPPAKVNTKEVKSEKKDKENTPCSGAAAGTGNAGNGGKKKGKAQKGNAGSDRAKGNAGSDKANDAPPSTGLVNANENRRQGANSVNLRPTFEQFSAIQGSPPVHVMNYNAAYPSKLGYGVAPQVPSSPYISYNTSEHMGTYQAPATTFHSFDIFSDENPNGCSIM